MIDEYTLSEINHDKYSSEIAYIQHLWRIVRSMMRLLSCKMQLDKKDFFRKKIQTALEEINKISVGENAEFINSNQVFKTETIIGEIFEGFIHHMEDIGMLTFKKDDPMKAMGRFSD